MLNYLKTLILLIWFTSELILNADLTSGKAGFISSDPSSISVNSTGSYTVLSLNAGNLTSCNFPLDSNGTKAMRLTKFSTASVRYNDGLIFPLSDKP